jgi:hypothetical protein
MEERTPHQTGTPPLIDLPAGAQVPLPFDDEVDVPIPFALTARARRTVAPHDLPALRVLPAPGSRAPSEAPDATDATEAADDPTDTRPARARALRRSGSATDAIADQLGVDELLVRAWTTGVTVARPARASTSGSSRRGATPHADASGGGAPPDPLHRGGRDAREEAARTAFELARAAAAATARERLAQEPRLAAGLGILTGLAELTPTAVDVTTDDPRLAGAVVRWLTEVLGADPAEVRVVLRVGPRAAADLARHRWARALGTTPERLRATRAVASVRDDAVEGVLRIVDADLAAAAAGWRDALLDGPPPADDAF